MFPKSHLRLIYFASYRVGLCGYRFFCEPMWVCACAHECLSLMDVHTHVHIQGSEMQVWGTIKSWHHKDLHLTLYAGRTPRHTETALHTAVVAQSQSHQPYCWQLSCPSTIPQHSKCSGNGQGRQCRIPFWKGTCFGNRPLPFCAQEEKMSHMPSGGHVSRSSSRIKMGRWKRPYL